MPLIMSPGMLRCCILPHDCDYMFDYTLGRERPTVMLEPAATTRIVLFQPKTLIYCISLIYCYGLIKSILRFHRSIFIECV